MFFFFFKSFCLCTAEYIPNQHHHLILADALKHFKLNTSDTENDLKFLLMSCKITECKKIKNYFCQNILCDFKAYNLMGGQVYRERDRNIWACCLHRMQSLCLLLWLHNSPATESEVHAAGYKLNYFWTKRMARIWGKHSTETYTIQFVFHRNTKHKSPYGIAYYF